MPNEIKRKYPTTATLTVTNLHSLATDARWNSALQDNTTTKWGLIHLYVTLKMNASVAPTANSVCEVYAVKADAFSSPNYTSDAVGASEAANTSPKSPNMKLLGTIRNHTSAAVNDIIYGDFEFFDPGPGWGVAVFNRTGQTLNASGNRVDWLGDNLEVQ